MVALPTVNNISVDRFLALGFAILLVILVFQGANIF